MIFVFGTYMFSRKADAQSNKITPEECETITNHQFYCPKCCAVRPALVYQKYPVFHFCFIPLIPFCCLTSSSYVGCYECEEQLDTRTAVVFNQQIEMKENYPTLPEEKQ